MYRLLMFFLLGVSLPALSKSLECQIMREQILKEVRGVSECDKYINNQNKNEINSPDTSSLQYSACKQGEIIGRGLVAGVNAMNGQPATLQDRLNLYKQKCE